MSEKIEELALPSAVIMRILKDTIPDGINISKEARATFARAAGIFALYITACATHVQASTQRKTITASDVFTALSDMLLEDMIEPLKEALEAFHAEKGKKAALATSPSKAGSGGGRGRKKKVLLDSVREQDSSSSTNILSVREQDSSSSTNILSLREQNSTSSTSNLLTEIPETEQIVEVSDINMIDINSVEISTTE